MTEFVTGTMRKFQISSAGSFQSNMLQIYSQMFKSSAFYRVLSGGGDIVREIKLLFMNSAFKIKKKKSDSAFLN